MLGEEAELTSSTTLLVDDSSSALCFSKRYLVTLTKQRQHCQARCLSKGELALQRDFDQASTLSGSTEPSPRDQAEGLVEVLSPFDRPFGRLRAKRARISQSSHPETVER